MPNTNSGALDVVLSAELAHVAGVLCDLPGIVSACPTCRKSFGCVHLHLLDLLAERGTVTGSVLSGNADLLCACIAVSALLESGSGDAYAWSCLRLCRGYLTVGGCFDVVKAAFSKIGRRVGDNPVRRRGLAR